MYGCKADELFTVRAMMKKDPFKLNLIFLVFSVIIFGNSVRICESPLSRVTGSMNYFKIQNSLWAVVLTMTTGNLIN